jgi:hypothetical protein
VPPSLAEIDSWLVAPDEVSRVEPELPEDRRGIRPSRHSKKHVECHVDVADNDNTSCASPVHHDYTIRRRSAESAAEHQSHG